MPAITDHPSFPQPEDPSVPLWRYMDFTKFMSILEKQSLYMARVDLLGDPFEGSVPKPILQIFGDLLASGKGTQLSDLSRLLSDQRKWSYASCWHHNPVESAAMWRLYAATGEAIAIRTTYARLRDVLDEAYYLGRVTYLDYQKGPAHFGTTLGLLMQKRQSFAHENEVRALLVSMPDDLTLKTGDGPPGVLKKVDINALIESIHISPTAPTWFHDLVEAVVRRYGYNFEVRQSEMNAEPLF